MQPYAQGSVTLDGTDRRLLKALAATPRTGPVELARRLEVARNTVQARLDKLLSQGVVVGFGPDVDLAAVGYVVSAFITLQIAQGRGSDVTDHLGSLPQVVEVHRPPGPGALFCPLVDPVSNAHLAEVRERIVEVDGIARTTTALVLDTPVPARVMPAIDALPVH